MILMSFLLDIIIGDPVYSWHPVRIMGNCIAALEKAIRKIFPKTNRGELIGGILLVIFMTAVFGGTAFLLFYWLYRISFWLGFAAETVVCCQLLAVKSLRDESMKVYYPLKDGDIEGARGAVSMIVGRDTAALDEEGITKAAVETVAENTSDGIGAPLFYAALFGAAGMCLYKAVNTMDSMVGYRNEKYEYFGKAAARVDDALNFIPSRLTAYAMLAATAIGRYDFKNAVKIYKRDKNNSKSPNAAKTEAAAAGALGIRLMGDAYYFGRLVKKPYIGDEKRRICCEDIKNVNRLMYMTAAVMALEAQAVRTVILWKLGGAYV